MAIDDTSNALLIIHVHQLHLSHHHWAGGEGNETLTSISDQFGCRTRASDDRWLFNCHGYCVVLAIHKEVKSKAHRYRDLPNTIFHHQICIL